MIHEKDIGWVSDLRGRHLGAGVRFSNSALCYWSYGGNLITRLNNVFTSHGVRHMRCTIDINYNLRADKRFTSIFIYNYIYIVYKYVTSVNVCN